MHLVGFTIEIYYDARPYERKMYAQRYIFKPGMARNQFVQNTQKIKILGVTWFHDVVLPKVCETSGSHLTAL